MRINPFLFFFTFLFTACSITENITFDKDFSGTIAYHFDLSLMSSLAHNDTAQATYDLDEPLQQAAQMLSQISGITDITINYEPESLIADISFRFKDVEALNNSYSVHSVYKNENSFMENPVFAVKGNQLFFSRPAAKTDSTNSQLGEMKEMFQYNLTLAFASSIKKVNSKKGNPNYFEINDTTNTAVCKASIFEVFPTNETELTIKLKKK